MLFTMYTVYIRVLFWQQKIPNVFLFSYNDAGDNKFLIEKERVTQGTSQPITALKVM